MIDMYGAHRYRSNVLIVSRKKNVKKWNLAICSDLLLNFSSITNFFFCERGIRYTKRSLRCDDVFIGYWWPYSIQLYLRFWTTYWFILNRCSVQMGKKRKKNSRCVNIQNKDVTTKFTSVKKINMHHTN